MDRPIGAGRMIHRSILDKLASKKLNLYDNFANDGMDTGSEQRITKFTKVEPLLIDTKKEPLILDIKTATNINPFILIKRRAENIDNSQEIIDYFSKYSDKLCRKYQITY